jgi:hypothetical protein
VTDAHLQRVKVNWGLQIGAATFKGVFSSHCSSKAQSKSPHWATSFKFPKKMNKNCVNYFYNFNSAPLNDPLCLLEAQGGHEKALNMFTYLNFQLGSILERMLLGASKGWIVNDAHLQRVKVTWVLFSHCGSKATVQWERCRNFGDFLKKLSQIRVNYNYTYLFLCL